MIRIIFRCGLRLVGSYEARPSKTVLYPALARSVRVGRCCAKERSMNFLVSVRVPAIAARAPVAAITA